MRRDLVRYITRCPVCHVKKNVHCVELSPKGLIMWTRGGVNHIERVREAQRIVRVRRSLDKAIA